MDASQFDYWKRGIGEHSSRRSILRALVALGVALLPGSRLLRAEPVAAE